MFPFGICPGFESPGHYVGAIMGPVSAAERLGLRPCRPRTARFPAAFATPTTNLWPGRPARAESSSRIPTPATPTPPGGSHDEVVHIVRLQRGQFVIRDPESAASPRDPPVPNRPKAIACGTSRRRRLGYLRHAVLHEVVHHETSALIRPFREPVIRQLGELKRRDLLARDVPREFEGIVRIIGMERRQRPIRRRREDAFVDVGVRPVDFLAKFGEFPYLRIPT